MANETPNAGTSSAQQARPAAALVPQPAKPPVKPGSGVATMEGDQQRAEQRQNAMAVLGERAKTPAPAPLDREATEGIVTSFLEIRTKLDGIVGESSGRLVELKLAAAESFDRAFTRLEDEARHVRDSLARNESLAREAAKVVDQARVLETDQEELEASVEQLQERVKALTERGEELSELKGKLDETKGELEDAVREQLDESSRLQGEVDRLTTKKDGLETETTKLEKAKTKLEEDVARLVKLREEYLAAIKRLRDSKDELTNEAEKD